MNKDIVLGIDVGASGIKGALVNVQTGELVGSRIRLEMPFESTPQAVAALFAQIVTHFAYSGVVGVGFPSVVKKDIAKTAANLDKSWIGCDIAHTFELAAPQCEVVVLNDADAAGIAEMHFGKGQGVKGTVVLITIGTGLGSAVFRDGVLLPNTEFGHFLMENGMVAEKYTSGAVQKRDNLPWRKWGKRFNEYLTRLDLYLQPDLILLGGGGSKEFAEYQERITLTTPVLPAKLLNSAGIIGAAVYASAQ